MSEILLHATDIKQYFPIKKADGKKALLKAVDGVSINIEKGETFGLVGESGCGKSTLGKVFLNLYPLTGGKVELNGVDISGLRGKELKDFRREAQMIFQDPASCLNPRRKVVDILLEPYLIHHMYDKAGRLENIHELCELVGLSESYLKRYPHEMSGGQKQRVGIARALALRPQLVICDEPVSALDLSIQAQVINLLEDLQKELGLTYLFISHNLSVVKHCCDRIAVMYLGRIVERASTDQIFGDPLHPYSRALISAIPAIDQKDKTEHIPLTGEIPSPVSPPSGCAFHTRCPEVTERCKREQPEFREVRPGHFAACHLCT